MSLAQFPVYTVSQINGYLKKMMEEDSLLAGLLIRGEISNYKCYPSGHHYFSLKDAQGTLRCVMFRGDASRLRFRPVNGMRVVAFGRISVFPRDGQYQLYCSELIDDGRGALDLAFEQLKQQLDREGLFAPEHKMTLPDFPQKIALITSPAGAAVRDMIRVLGVRWPMAELLVVPVRVQGEGAAAEIAEAINRINNRADVDLIITGRGGGSKEDLWAFNEEIVARAIFVSNIPVISAVGHEPDVSISDYVADLRAATPSNGAELAAPDQADVRRQLEHLQRRLAVTEQAHVKRARDRLGQLADSRVLRNIKAPIEDRRILLDSWQQRLYKAMSSRLKEQRAQLELVQHRFPGALGGQIKDRRARLARLSAGLQAMSPLKVLGRGYAIAKGEKGVVASIKQTEIGAQVELMISDGLICCEVKGMEERTWR